MVSGHEGKLGDAADEADLAKAFQAIAQGEHTATQLEQHLTKLESKIDELMKQATENTDLAEAATAEQTGTSVADSTTKPSTTTNASTDKST